jgi:hypothetical protein
MILKGSGAKNVKDEAAAVGHRTASSGDKEWWY